MNTNIKKWSGVIFSFLISTAIVYIVASPIILAGEFIGESYLDQHEYFMARLIWIISWLIPILVVIFLVFKILNKDILHLVSENLDESGDPILLDPNENQEDEINQKIVTAFNKAKDKLKINKEIKLIRMVGSPYINAFAIGNTKGEAAIVVFDELVKNTDQKMIQAVIGHELGHIKNKDTITNIILYANQYAIPILSNMSDKINNIVLRILKDIPYINLLAVMAHVSYKVISITITVPGNWITHTINLFVSRESEHLADKAGVEASSKETMLKTLKFLSSIEDENSNTNSLLEFLASTHPPISKRIEYISNL